MEFSRGGVGTRRANLNWCRPLTYLSNSESRPVIALVSFPGSGNTWLRYLLQQATGMTSAYVYHTIFCFTYNLCEEGFAILTVFIWRLINSYNVNFFIIHSG